MASLHTLREIEHHDVVSPGMFTDEFPDKHPQEWMKHVLITLEEAMDAYIVEVTVEFHC